MFGKTHLLLCPCLLPYLWFWLSYIPFCLGSVCLAQLWTSIQRWLSERFTEIFSGSWDSLLMWQSVKQCRHTRTKKRAKTLSIKCVGLSFFKLFHIYFFSSLSFFLLDFVILIWLKTGPSPIHHALLNFVLLFFVSVYLNPRGPKQEKGGAFLTCWDSYIWRYFFNAWIIFVSRKYCNTFDFLKKFWSFISWNGI